MIGGCHMFALVITKQVFQSPTPEKSNVVQCREEKDSRKCNDLLYYAVYYCIRTSIRQICVSNNSTLMYVHLYSTIKILCSLQIDTITIRSPSNIIVERYLNTTLKSSKFFTHPKFSSLILYSATLRNSCPSNKGVFMNKRMGSVSP